MLCNLIGDTTMNFPLSPSLRTLIVGAVITICANQSAYSTIHNVDVGNFFFAPTKTVVSPGDTVRWTIVSMITQHTTTSNIGSPKTWNSGLMSIGNSFDVVFTIADGPGPFPYHCAVHPFSMKDTIFMAPLPPDPDPIRFAFTIDGKQANACAGTGSDHMGMGVCILSPDSSELSIHVWHDIPSDSLLESHIHTAPECVGGAVTFAFSSPTSPIVETWSLTSTDVSNLLAGNLYVNIHTDLVPAGEIRGQIVQEPVKFAFTVDEAQANDGTGTGKFSNGVSICKLSADASTLDIAVCHDAQNTTEGHIHLGAPGVGGPIQFGFSSATSPISESWSLDTTDLFNLMSGDLYVNIHTSAFLAGEIRGQIVQTELIFALCINGDQANAGVGTGSDHLGFGVLALSKDCSTLRVHVEHDIPSDSVLDSHIHLGAEGVGGPIQFGFASSVSPIVDTWALSAGDVANLFDGNLYVNIHSDLFPAGEIRGQIPGVVSVAAAARYPTFTSNLDGSQADACVGTGSDHTGTATLELKKGGKELTVTVDHTLASDSVIDSHIHNGDSCVSGPIVFGFANSVSVVEDIWYLSESDVIDLLQGGLYVNLHSLAFNAGEIRGQIAKPGPPQACCDLPGDADDGGDVNIGDAIFIVKYAFVAGSPKPPCCDQADADGGGDVNIGDAIFIVKFAFVEGSPPPLCPPTGPLECL